MLFYKAYEILSSLRARLERQEGQALVEYALILALIAIVSIAVLKLIGVNVSRVFNGVNTQLNSVPDTPAP
jgi:pilus assembly protein Flp/PilA